MQLAVYRYDLKLKSRCLPRSAFIFLAVNQIFGTEFNTLDVNLIFENLLY